MGAGARDVLHGRQARMVVVLVMAFLHNGHHKSMSVVMPIMAMVVAVVVVVVMGLGAVMAILFPLAGKGQGQCKCGRQYNGGEYFHG
jgi:hypothetical protein